MSLGEARNPVGSQSSLLRAVMGRDGSLRPHHPWWVPYRRLALLCDILAVGTAMVVATTLRSHRAASVTGTGVAWLSPPFLATLIGASWILALVVCRAYSHHLLGIGGDEYRRVAHATFMLGGVLSAVAVLVRMDIARGFVFTALSLGAVLLLAGRRGMRQVLVRKRRGGAMLEDSLLIGSRAGVTWTVERIRATPAAGYRVSALACAEPDAPGVLALADGTVVCNLRHWDRLPQLLDETGLRTVIVADDAQTDRALLRHLSERVEDLDAQLVLTNRLADVLGPRTHWRPVGGMSLMAVDILQCTSFERARKRAVDVVVVGLGRLVSLSCWRSPSSSRTEDPCCSARSTRESMAPYSPCTSSGPYAGEHRGTGRVSAFATRPPERCSHCAGTPRDLGGPDAAGVALARKKAPEPR